MSKLNSERINVSLSPEILTLIDGYCTKYGDSRSAFVRRAVLNYCDSMRMLENMPEFIKVAKEALEQNKEVQLSGQLHLADLASRP